MSRLIESVSRPLQVKNAKTLSGLFAVTDTFNQNGRRYPEPVYREAYEELIPKIKERRLLGELDHPLDRDEVFLSNVSHVITECHVGTSKSGHQVYYGTVELLDTPGILWPKLDNYDNLHLALLSYQKILSQSYLRVYSLSSLSYLSMNLVENMIVFVRV